MAIPFPEIGTSGERVGFEEKDVVNKDFYGFSKPIKTLSKEFSKIGGRSSSGGRRICRGQAAQLREGSRVPGPPPRCPRKVNSAEGAAKGAQEEVTRLSAKPAPAKVERKPKKAAGKGKSSDKKSANKGEKGAKGKQAKVANQETKEDLPAENGETKNKESPASDEAGEKEAKSN
ncbi:non-histone chromosomal protein HMG-14-like [Mirounga angustirostris]|uniref:non-histone chromosomal protein HMG-14-like n=1 Tax=Mirounga angustirostris TaxID=9716 RepID=UPI001E687F10|nr:non-histone chromosomal protein HMG-14-like [Mirounga angustirostris]